jgi:hypothetical protein
MKCFDCGEEITKAVFKDESGNETTSTDVKFIPLDVPYVNLPFHRSTCYINVIAKGEENYLRENLNRIIDFIDVLDAGKIKVNKKIKRGR